MAQATRKHRCDCVTVPVDAAGRPNAKVLQVVRYFDAVNFAARTKARALVGVGFVDPSCPPTTVYAAYNALRGPKRIITGPLSGHNLTQEMLTAMVDEMRAHVRETRNAPSPEHAE